MIVRKKFLLLFFVFIAIPSLAFADFPAFARQVKDGDTIVVLIDNHIPVNVRLQR